MRRSDRSSKTSRAILSASLAIAMAGCAASSTPDFVRDYNAGRYTLAQRQAADRASKPGGDRDQAALIAGLSAHAAGDHAEARRWLEPLVDHADSSRSGRAAAALGLIHFERGQHRRAAALLAEAASKLTGEDAARAGFHAGEAYSALGRTDAARLQYNLALSTAEDPDLRSVLTDRLDRNAYTIQLGAFSNRANARRTARRYAPVARDLGLGRPVIRAQRAPRRRTLYLVQVGQFKQKDAATVARSRIGGDAIIAAIRTSE